MPPRPDHEFIAFQRMARHKQTRAPQTQPVGEALVSFFKQNIEKKHTKVGKLTEAWIRLIPPTLCDHCTLDGMHRGTLTVLVDSSSHLYELKQLLLAGLEQQLVLVCKSAGLRKVTLRAGRPADVPDERPRANS